MKTAKSTQVLEKKDYIPPTLIVKGDIAALTQGEKTIGLTDGWIYQGQGLETVSS